VPYAPVGGKSPVTDNPRLGYTRELTMPDLNGDVIHRDASGSIRGPGVHGEFYSLFVVTMGTRQKYA
jgi:hypothetical protein